jgi:hypothetical protein
MYLRNLSGMSGTCDERTAVRLEQLLCCVCNGVEPVLLPELAAERLGSCQAIDVSMTASRQKNRRQMKICQCIIRRDASARARGVGGGF